MTTKDMDGRLTVSITREQLEGWAGRPLADSEVALLDDCLPNTSLSEVIGTVVGTFEQDFGVLFVDVLREALGPEADAVAAIRWTGWQLAKLTSQSDPFKPDRDPVQERYGLDERDSRYRWAVSYLADTLDGEQTLLAHEEVVLYLDSGGVNRSA